MVLNGEETEKVDDFEYLGSYIGDKAKGITFREPSLVSNRQNEKSLEVKHEEGSKYKTVSIYS